MERRLKITKKTEFAIKKLYKKISNINNDHIHQFTTALVKTKPKAIVIEDLNVMGMMKNKHLSRAIGELGLYRIRKILEYKCEWNGIPLIVADRFYPSSKLCNCCGWKKVDLKLKNRVFYCDNCGHVEDRDLNASKNLAKLA